MLRQVDKLWREVARYRSPFLRSSPPGLGFIIIRSKLSKEIFCEFHFSFIREKIIRGRSFKARRVFWDALLGRICTMQGHAALGFFITCFFCYYNSNAPVDREMYR